MRIAVLSCFSWLATSSVYAQVDNMLNVNAPTENEIKVGFCKEVASVFGIQDQRNEAFQFCIKTEQPYARVSTTPRAAREIVARIARCGGSARQVSSNLPGTIDVEVLDWQGRHLLNPENECGV